MQSKLPRFIATLVGSIGVMDIVSALVPAAADRWRIVLDLLPIQALHTSRTLTLVSGVFLVSLARGLWQQKKRAWTMAIVVLSLTLIFHLTKGLDIEEVFITSLTLIILWYFRSLYFVESHRRAFITSLARSLVILTILFIYTLGGYLLLHSNFSGTDNFSSIRSEYLYDTTGLGHDQLRAQNRFARWFENSISLVSILAILAMITTLFEPALESTKPSASDYEVLQDLLGEDCDETGYFALMADKSLWFDESRSHVIAYKKAGKYAVVLGLPHGGESKKGTMWQFQEYVIKLGGEVLWYNESDSVVARELGLSAIKIGEDALINTTSFTLDGPKLKSVRNAVSHTQKLNCNFIWYSMADLPWSDLRQLNDLYETWVGDKKIASLSFSLGFYPFPPLALGQVLLLNSSTGQLLAALSFFPYHSGHGYVLDLMLRSASAPSGTVETAIVDAINHFKNNGVSELNLGMAPLSNIEFMGNNQITQSLRSMLMTQFNKFYGYKSLADFKAKFDPVWQPKYIYLKSPSLLPAALLAIAQAHRK